jgi:geranylgeranyl diphosphate synthase type II
VAKFYLENYLRVRREAVDRALLVYLDRHSAAQNIWQAMRYSLFPGGKRIRPILLLAAGELFAGARSALMPFACAVEMIHAYSLVHDDLPALDNDDLRRGAPTVHKVYGEGLALLAGDGLLTEAFHLLSLRQRELPAELVLELTNEISLAAGAAGLVGGQAADLEAEQTEADLATVELIHVRKTGALILASVRTGARVAGAKGADLRRISRYGEFLGLAFQVADDIIDFQCELPGLASGRKEQQKATYPAVMGIVQAKKRLKDLLAQAFHQLNSYGDEAEPLRALAGFVGNQALREVGESLNEEMHP